jgi:hypothetical protein
MSFGPMRYQPALLRARIDPSAFLIPIDYRARLRALEGRDDHALDRWEGEGGYCLSA